jgi:hypothetical protein
MRTVGCSVHGPEITTVAKGGVNPAGGSAQTSRSLAAKSARIKLEMRAATAELLAEQPDAGSSPLTINRT